MRVKLQIKINISVNNPRKVSKRANYLKKAKSLTVNIKCNVCVS